MKTETLFSRATSEWETPPELFSGLNAVFHFTLDAAATPDNAKCEKFFTAEDNALEQSWAGETVWCNPPYGRCINAWVKKAWEESREPSTKVVMLLPARTDTAWFHDYAMKGCVKFLRGRVRFGGAKNNAPFPSMILIFE